MVRFPNSRSIFPSQTLISLFFFLFFDPISSSTLPTLSFDPDIAVIGAAAKVPAGDGSYVKLNSAGVPTAGILMHTKPLRLLRSTSFDTEFTFSISPENGHGLVLSLFPGSFAGDGVPRERGFHSIEFVTAAGGKVSNLSGGYMRTEMGVLVPNGAEKMTSWVDYDSGSEKLEVRVRRFGESRPYNPLFAYSIDLVEKCGGEEVFMGLSSENSNSSQFSIVFAWRVSLRNVPNWLHSLPVDLQRYSGKNKEHRFRPLTIFAGLIFAAAAGALIAFVALFMWAIAANRHTVFPAEPRSEGFRYDRVSVVVEEEFQDDGVGG